MGKRKRREKEKVEKKIKKLYKKLRTMESDSESTDPATTSSVEEVLPVPIEENLLVEEHMEEPLPIEEPVVEALPVEEIQCTGPETETPAIDVELLSALGEIEEVRKGPIDHDEIAQRWTPILTKGLQKEYKAELMKKYIPYEDIPMLPPKLNPEIVAAVSDPVKKRDLIIADRQKQMVAALTALGQSLHLFLLKGDRIEIIKHINEAAKILCDAVHTDTNNRRSLISTVINKDMKDSLTGEADTYLFGSNLSEKIKVTKAVQKSVKDLKNTSFIQNPPNKTKSFNWRGPPRPSARTGTGGRSNQLAKLQKKDERKPRQPFWSNKNKPMR